MEEFQVSLTDIANQANLRRRQRNQVRNFTRMIAPHLQYRNGRFGSKPEEVSRYPIMIVGIAKGLQHSAGPALFENCGTKLLGTGFAATPGDRQLDQLRKFLPVCLRQALESRKPMLHLQTRNPR